MKKKYFSERLYDLVMELISSVGAKKLTDELNLQENYFSPSKYNPARFKGKAISHLDKIEEQLGVDLLADVKSALAREIEKAEADGILSQHDRNAIRHLLKSAREHADSRGPAALEKIKAQKSAVKKK